MWTGNIDNSCEHNKPFLKVDSRIKHHVLKYRVWRFHFVPRYFMLFFPCDSGVCQHAIIFGDYTMVISCLWLCLKGLDRAAKSISSPSLWEETKGNWMQSLHQERISIITQQSVTLKVSPRCRQVLALDCDTQPTLQLKTKSLPSSVTHPVPNACDLRLSLLAKVLTGRTILGKILK